MIYVIAKGLKDAGWLQEERGRRGDDIFFQDEMERLYIPTLTELIAACDLENDSGYFSILAASKGWWAGYREVIAQGKDYLGNAHFGSTIEEAVAKLWLALRKL